MRTLIVSDLHLGNQLSHDVLRAAPARDRLLDALEGVDRLVLLGDTAELMGRRPHTSLAAAEPVLRALGRRLGPRREVILVPGNHDAPLVRGWARRQGDRLRPSSRVPPDASPALARVAGCLAPASVRVHYPGVWLRDGTWATHGHYLDRHLMPESAIGVLRPGGRPTPGEPMARPCDYEHGRRRTRGSSAAQGARGPLGTALEQLAALPRAAGIRILPRLAASAGLTSVSAAVADLQMRRAATPAIGRVVQRLGIDADWVLFGHVHRRGPIGEERWPQPGTTRFVNPGSWLYEPMLTDGARPPHPYWPGGAVLLDDDRPPRTVGLLDDLGAPAALGRVPANRYRQ